MGDNAGLVQALKLLPVPPIGSLLMAVVQGNADLHIGGCADLLARAAAVSAWRGQVLGAARALLDAMPGDPPRAQSPADAWRRERVDDGVVHDTLRALAPAGPTGLFALAEQAVTHWLAWPKTYGMDAVIVPALRRLAERPALLNRPACLRLRAAALDHLRARASLDLAPPADWRREARMSCRCEHCLALARFLRSADQEVWRFKARKADRRHVEDSIPSGPARRRLQHRAQGQPACAGVHQEPGELRAQGRATKGRPRRSGAAQGVGPFGRAAHLGCDDMVSTPPPRDRLHGLAFEGEPGLAFGRVHGQRVFELTEGLALSQRLPERPAKLGIAALIDEVLHHAEGFG